MRAARTRRVNRPGRVDYRLAPQHFKSLPVTEWNEVLGSERHTGPRPGRLTHHAHMLKMNLDN